MVDVDMQEWLWRDWMRLTSTSEEARWCTISLPFACPHEVDSYSDVRRFAEAGSREIYTLEHVTSCDKVPVAVANCAKIHPTSR
jgi:hypothetical protein